MPRRQLLNSTERLELLAFPTDQAELIRLYSLNRQDRTFISQHRGDHNRLGIAVQMAYLRFPGRVLGEREVPYEPLLDLLSAQLEIPAAAWNLYAKRDPTRRGHLGELVARMAMQQFNIEHYRSLVAWLETIALQTTRGLALAQALVEELRRRLIVLPSLAVIERITAEAGTRAQRKLFSLLTKELTAQQRTWLDASLEMREGSPYSLLSWLRMPPGAPTARAVLLHIERLEAIRALNLSPEAGRELHQNRLLQLAREAGQTAAYQLKEYEPARRYGTLVALMIETGATLTDEILNLHDRLMGGFVTKSRNKYERAFAEQGKAINDKVRLYARVGAALVEAREQGRDPFAAIEAVVPWASFSASVKEAAELARDEDFSALSLIDEHYPQLRRYGPKLLDTFEFRAAPVARSLLAAIEMLRRIHREGLRKVPTDAPIAFIRQGWKEHVLGADGIDRRFYEICVMAELKNALRSGDISVVGSRQFRDFEDYLMPRTEFDRRLAESTLHVRDETYSRALAELVNYQHRLPFAAHWGEGKTSSSDGQRFRAGGRGEAAGQVNLKYGNDPGVTFYTHISDQYAPFHTKVINAAVRDATHVLDGLLYHESDLRIEEHYTDTAGFTDHVFGLCHLLGFRFAPRIRDLADKRLYVPGKAAQWPALAPLIGGPVKTKLIQQQLAEVLRLAESIQQGTVTASLILRKLGSYPRQNSLAVALREIGRVERTLFMLEWIADPALRRRVSAGLNKGEARNSLARAVFFNRLGEVRDRSFENQRHRASGLNLVVAAVTLWNTVYLERAAAQLAQSQTLDTAHFQHASPLGWGNINLTGDYTWHINKRVATGGFRPLRKPSPAFFSP